MTGLWPSRRRTLREDLKKITIPVLVMHSEDDQIVPYVPRGRSRPTLLKNGTLIRIRFFRMACLYAGGEDQRRPPGIPQELKI